MIGSRLVRGRVRDVPLGWLLLGTLLPDVIDKPIYYGLVVLTGRRGAQLGLFSSGRTFGHTLLFLLALFAAARLARSRPLAAVAWGVATHLLLDNIGDQLGDGTRPNALDALLFPLLGAHFPVLRFQDWREHLGSVKQLYVLAGELIGLLLLYFDLRARRRRLEGAR
jgi:hypothetical protein